MAREVTIPNEVREPTVDVGGRGPDMRPPAGGEGGGDEGRRQPEGNPRFRRRLLRARIGLGAAAVGISIFFLAMSSAYLVRQGTGPSIDRYGREVGAWIPLMLPQIVWFNTLLLIASSVTAEMARRQLFHQPALTEEWLGLGKPTQRRALPWMGITLLLGVGFLAGQYLAWREMNIAGWGDMKSPSSSFFFIFTGAHAAHLVGGLIALAWASVATALSRPIETRQVLTDISVWYWHLMGAVWLGILGLMYFAR